MSILNCPLAAETAPRIHKVEANETISSFVAKIWLKSFNTGDLSLEIRINKWLSFVDYDAFKKQSKGKSDQYLKNFKSLNISKDVTCSE